MMATPDQQWARSGALMSITRQVLLALWVASWLAVALAFAYREYGETDTQTCTRRPCETMQPFAHERAD